MNRTRFVSSSHVLALVRTLRGASVAVAVLMIIAFLVGCESTKPTSQTEENGILRAPDNGHAVHGEVGAMYGRSG